MFANNFDTRPMFATSVLAPHLVSVNGCLEEFFINFDLLSLGHGFSAFLRASPYFCHSSGRIKGIESHEHMMERFVASHCWGWEESDSSDMS
jgi:hypothetical protein